MLGLPRTAWERFGIWLVLGAVIYAFYGYRHSQLRRVHERRIRPTLIALWHSVHVGRSCSSDTQRRQR